MFSVDFFEVSAQLVPVFFLAMVVEERLQPRTEERAADRVTRSWLFVLLVAAEIIALSVVAGGLAPGPGAGSLVGIPMLLAAFLMVLPVVAGELGQGRSRREELGHGLVGLFLIVVVAGVAISIATGQLGT